MIKINLANPKHASYLDGGTKAEGRLGFPKGSAVDLTTVQAARKILVPLILGVVMNYGLGYYKDNQLEALDTQISAVNTL